MEADALMFGVFNVAGGGGGDVLASRQIIDNETAIRVPAIDIEAKSQDREPRREP